MATVVTATTISKEEENDTSPTLLGKAIAEIGVYMPTSPFPSITLPELNNPIYHQYDHKDYGHCDDDNDSANRLLTQHSTQYHRQEYDEQFYSGHMYSLHDSKQGSNNGDGDAAMAIAGGAKPRGRGRGRAKVAVQALTETEMEMDMEVEMGEAATQMDTDADASKGPGLGLVPGHAKKKRRRGAPNSVLPNLPQLVAPGPGPGSGLVLRGAADAHEMPLPPQLQLHRPQHAQLRHQRLQLTPAERKKLREHKRGLVCCNCAATTTPIWRRHTDGVRFLCNACGLYWRHNQKMRPVPQPVQPAQPAQPALSGISATTPAATITTANHQHTPSLSSNANWVSALLHPNPNLQIVNQQEFDIYQYIQLSQQQMEFDLMCREILNSSSSASASSSLLSGNLQSIQDAQQHFHQQNGNQMQSGSSHSNIGSSNNSHAQEHSNGHGYGNWIRVSAGGTSLIDSSGAEVGAINIYGNGFHGDGGGGGGGGGSKSNGGHSEGGDGDGDKLADVNFNLATDLTFEEYVDASITVETKGGHSSVPPKHTGIGYTALAIAALESKVYPINLSDNNPILGSTRCYAQHSKKVDPFIQWAIENLNNGGRQLLAAKLSDRDLRTAALLTTTQATDIIYGGLKVNALPEKVTAIVNHRIAVDSSLAATQKHITEVLLSVAKENKLSLTVNQFDDPEKIAFEYSIAEALGKISVSPAFGKGLEPAPSSPANGDGSIGWSILEGTIHYVFDEDSQIIVSPSMSSGNTDTRHYWGLSKSIYRFAPTGGINAHTVDEHIELKKYIKAIKNWEKMLRNKQALLPRNTILVTNSFKLRTTNGRNIIVILIAVSAAVFVWLHSIRDVQKTGTVDVGTIGSTGYHCDQVPVLVPNSSRLYDFQLCSPEFAATAAKRLF
ncbi:hypothetical protein HK100_000793 [Physocladia obscura]|uniref:GATA-type domain-containing protein n=1 Tax=Physocladia obscura TaxID=109957 RepID=A0AAD5XLP7_9FUNG|nr:hypothetical protein HK100_000793 [Physocladia obscura]